jgi:hypothetical protein
MSSADDELDEMMGRISLEFNLERDTEGYASQTASTVTDSVCLCDVLCTTPLMLNVMSYVATAPLLAYGALRATNKDLSKSLLPMRTAIFEVCKVSFEKFYAEKKGVILSGLRKLYEIENISKIEIAGGSVNYMLGHAKKFGINARSNPDDTDVDIFLHLDGAEDELGHRALCERVDEILRSHVFRDPPDTEGVPNFYDYYGYLLAGAGEGLSRQEDAIGFNPRVTTYHITKYGPAGIQIVYWCSDRMPWKLAYPAETRGSSILREPSVTECFDIEICACAMQIGSSRAREAEIECPRGGAPKVCDEKEHVSIGQTDPGKDTLICLHPDKMLELRCTMSRYHESILQSLLLYDPTSSVHNLSRVYISKAVDSLLRSDTRFFKYLARGYDQLTQADVDAWTSRVRRLKSIRDIIPGVR